MARAAKKRIALSFFQLNPDIENSNPVENSEELKKISEVFLTQPTATKPVKLSDSSVNFYGKVEKQGALFLGTVIKNQLSNIPPSYDEVAGIAAKLPLSSNEGLGYQTSFLYDPALRIIMIESVKNGVNVNVLCLLLQKNFDIPDIQASLVINPARLQEFYNMRVISKFQVKVARLEQGTIFNTKKNSSIGQIIHSADDTNTDLLEYTLGVRKKNKSLKRSKISTLIRSFLRYEETDEVKKLLVTGKEEEEGHSNSINFIEQRLTDFVFVKQERLIETFEVKERYEKLLDVYNKHKPSLQIYKVKRR